MEVPALVPVTVRGKDSQEVLDESVGTLDNRYKDSNCDLKSRCQESVCRQVLPPFPILAMSGSDFFSTVGYEASDFKGQNATKNLGTKSNQGMIGKQLQICRPQRCSHPYR